MWGGKKVMMPEVLTALVDGLLFTKGKWTQVDDAVMQPFHFADARFDLFLIAYCPVNKWLDFSGARQTIIIL